MCMLYSPLRDVEEEFGSVAFIRHSRIRNSVCRQKSNPTRKISSIVLLEFRDEVYVTIASLLEQLDIVIHRAENTTELARQVVRNTPDLVLLSGTQTDESSWLTCAKLRIIDTSRPVWIYAPKPASAIDQWLSMASIDEIVVYGGVLDILLSALSDRLSQSISDEGRAKDKALPRKAF